MAKENEAKQLPLDKDFEAGEGLIKKRRKRRKNIGEEGSRKQTGWVLLITIILGLFFYLPNEVKNWWQDFKEPEVIKIEKPVGDAEDVSEVVGFKVVIKKKEDAEEVVERLIEGAAGEYSVYVKKTVAGFGINEDIRLTAASVIKLPILMVYYKAVDEGRIDPQTEYVLAENDRLVYGTGSMQNQPTGTRYSYKEIARLAANQSDNMAGQLLISFLGGEGEIEKQLQIWGFGKTKIGMSETTAKEIGEMFWGLYSGEYLTEESKNELFDSLTNTVLEDRLPAGVPTGIKVVHKFGSETGIVNDCGIVYSKEPYVICVLSEGINNGQAQELLPKISRIVWEWAGNN